MMLVVNFNDDDGVAITFYDLSDVDGTAVSIFG